LDFGFVVISIQNPKSKIQNPAACFCENSANVDKFSNNYLANLPRGAQISEIMAAAVGAVDAENAVRRNLRIENDFLKIGEKTFALREIGRIFVVGAGKAGAAMAKAADEILGDLIDAGLVITKDGHAEKSNYGAIEVVEAAHPVPDERAVENSARLKKLVENTNENDLVLVLISGGGSAVSTLPAENVSLEDLRFLTDELLRCGAAISEINCLRKHLTVLAGGGLAEIAFPAKICSLIISDVVGSPLDVIASGMTAPDSTDFRDARRVLEKYELFEKLPDSICSHLQKGFRGEIRDTPKADAEIWRNVSNFIVADNRLAANAAIEKAQEFGFDAKILTCSLEGEAREAGKFFAAIAREIALKDLENPFLLVAGGETTVTVRGQGKGGRNQELALGAVEGLAKIENAILATLATDGGDATDAAGAVVDGKTLEKAFEKNLIPADFLRRNDSYNFFEPLGALLKTGATMTNVNDLLFVFVFPKAD
jgi:glycerate 2-kinase